MNGAYLALANHLWQSTVFAGATAMLVLALRGNRARVRHWVWLAASWKFLIPFSALAALGNRIEWRTAPSAVPPNLPVAMDRATQPFTPSAASMPSQIIAPHAANLLGAALLAVWACGVLVIAFSWWNGWRRIRAALSGDTMRPYRPILEAGRCAGGAMPPCQGLRAGAPLQFGVFGIFRPVLMLPRSIADRLTPAQLQAVIGHELAHIRHKDNLIAAIHMFVETLFWFHPLVWWIGMRMVEERELACDEEVLRLGNDPRVYAEAILTICKLCVESPLACVAGVAGANLKRRIDSILLRRAIQPVSRAKKAALAILAGAALLLPFAIGLINAPQILAQSADPAGPKFDVASIKPCQPGVPNGGESSPGRLSSGCAPLAATDSTGLIQRAYVRFAGGQTHPVRVLEIQGAPEWVHTEMFTIDARAEGSPSLAMMQGPMLQALLEDRFKLKVHREIKQGPVYELAAAKGGSKLTASPEGSCVPMPYGRPSTPLPPGQTFCRSMVSPRGDLDAHGSTVADIAGLLSLVLDRPVIDKTGIAGKFDVRLRFSPEDLTAKEPGVAPASDAPDVFNALQAQLGLKLTPAKGPVEVLVIDHVERPSAN